MSSPDGITVLGGPTAEQLAAVVVLLRHRPATEQPARAVGRAGWADRHAALRGELARGPGGWRAAGRLW